MTQLRSLLVFLSVLTPGFRVAFAFQASPEPFRVVGSVYDSAGEALQNASVELRSAGEVKTHAYETHAYETHASETHAPRAQALTDNVGHYSLSASRAGNYQVIVHAAGFQSQSKILVVTMSKQLYSLDLTLVPGARDSVTVTADVNRVELFSPDPAEKVFVRQNLIDANPGRPGAPVSIPGYPIETASGGIKAPQYFAPGVAGDHGEPIAEFISIGSYLLPNNLSSNAHGNGYADPNILIPATIADVEVDGGAFNVLEGNHSVNLAATYGLRTALNPFLTLTADYRDLDLSAGLSPGPSSWIAMEASYGNGLLARLEHRQQYKISAGQIIEKGRQHITFFGLGYYGFSYIPGLVPIGSANADDATFPNVGDTIDPRQKEQTHTALVAINDAWTLDGHQQVQFSGFFRTYNLSLFSDFGAGLIRQSEFRTVTGSEANYTNKISEHLSVLTGLDFEREAPRRDDLDHYDFYTPGNNSYGPFTKVDGSNVTITPIAPYAAVEGAFGGHLRYYAGWRRDQIDFNNEDLVQPQNSFQQWVGVNSPKATVSVVPGPAKWVPLISGSFGESFFTEDPRIGTGTTQGPPVSRAHSFQLVASKTFAHTDLKLTLGHVTTGEELAKIDPDTGLQEDEGPGRLRFLTATVRQSFNGGTLLATFSKADARDIDSGQPTPEAPRTIVDLLGTTNRLPFHLRAKGEFEYVGAKPLGTGCEPDLAAQCFGVPVREIRLAVEKTFLSNRFDAGVNVLAASGYTGQTLENFYPSNVAQVTGVRLPSYASVSFRYHFGAAVGP